MRFCLILTFIASSSLCTSAQNLDFAPVNSQWIYYLSDGNLYYSYTVSKVVGDTVIAGKSLRHCEVYTYNLTTEDGNSFSRYYQITPEGIQLYYPSIDSLFPYMDMDANVGDTITTLYYYSTISGAQYSYNRVDSVYYKTIEGVYQRVLLLGVIEPVVIGTLLFTGEFYSVFGSVHNLNPWPAGSPYSVLKCYSNDLIEYEYVSGGCDYLPPEPVPPMPADPEYSFEIHPNPAMYTMQVVFPFEVEDEYYYVTSITGIQRPMEELPNIFPDNSFSLAGLDTGLYFLTVVFQGNIYVTKPFFKL